MMIIFGIAVLLMTLIILSAIAAFYAFMFSVGVIFVVLVGIAIVLGYWTDSDPKSILWLGLIPLMLISCGIWGYLDQRAEAKAEKERLALEEIERQKRASQTYFGRLKKWLG